MSDDLEFPPEVQKIIDAHPMAFVRAVGRRNRKTRSLASDEVMKTAMAELREVEDE